VEYRFDGAIAGLGSSSGTRFVVGIWPVSPFGAFADVMVERGDGSRILLAPTAEVGDFVAATYRFDEVRVEQFAVEPAGTQWTVTTPSLDLQFATGRRTGLGRLLMLVPPAVARTRGWCRAIDPFARRLRPGVRTAGTAGGGRREYYCALDEHRIDAARGVLDGVDAGRLARLEPPVRFGFGSAPVRPALVRVTTIVDA